MTTFTYTDAELDFGTHSLGGDWTLTISSDDNGQTFKLIDAETCLKGVSKTCFALIEEWIADDLAKAGKSFVRKAYDDHVWQFENESARFHVEPPVDLSLIGRRAA